MTQPTPIGTGRIGVRVSRELLQYRLPEQFARWVTQDRPTRVNIARLWCGDIARGDEYGVEEFVAGAQYAANFWWWTMAIFFGLTVALAWLFSSLVARSNPVWLMPQALLFVGGGALGQYPVLVHRVYLVRRLRRTLVDEPIPARHKPKQADFWIGLAFGLTCMTLAKLGRGSAGTFSNSLERSHSDVIVGARVGAMLAAFAGWAILTNAVRHRPDNWRRMSWREVANAEGAREGLFVLGALLLILAGIGLGLLTFAVG
jgi:hypothetical protein